MSEAHREIDQLEAQLLALGDIDGDALEIITRLATVVFPEGFGFGDRRRTVWSEPRGRASSTSFVHPASVASRLRRSEARLRDLVDQMPAVVFLAALDEEQNEVYVSPQVESLLGFTQDEWLNNPLLWYSQLHPDDHQVVIDAFTHGVQTGGPFRAEVRFFTRDGRTVWILGEAKLIRDDEGRPEYFQGIGFDITASKEAQELAATVERERAEAQLLRAEALAAANTELTRLNVELRAAKIEADAAAAARGTFLATMSHELRTPMNSVIVLANLLADTELTPAQEDMLGGLDLAANHLLTLINDILDFSRLRAGRVDLDLKEVDVKEWVETSLEIVAPRAAEKDLGLRYRVEPDVPVVMVADDARLRQVLLNLLGNALKFTVTGDVEVSIWASPLGGDRWRYRCAVADTGPGIAAEKMGQLFGEFEQADGGIAREHGGTGLGLAISKSLVELMDGTIDIDSEEGRGSTFTFSWCCDSDFSSVGEARVRDRIPALEGRRLLVVDDQPGDLELFRELATALGCLVDVTTVPADAIARVVAGHEYDLVIVDEVMGGTGGLEVVETMADVLEDGLPPVAITTFAAHVLEERSERTAVRGVITKPLRHRHLGRILVGLIEGTAVPSELFVSSSPGEVGPVQLRILVAEDSVMNQKVIQLLLDAIGYKADVVDTGEKAISAVRGTSYDVVLMDMMMPNTDGLAATRAIRALGDTIHQPHIVAVTANALPGDRDACIEAGMDDYIAKPIERAVLAAKLAAAGSGLPTAVLQATTPATPEPPSSSSGDGAELDEATANELRDQYGDEAFAAVVSLFGTTAAQCVEQLETAFAGSDTEGVRHASHTLKSSARTLGAARLAHCCQTIEMLARERALDDVSRDDVEEIAVLARRAQDRLQEIVAASSR